jgi:hypothetical protein
LAKRVNSGNKKNSGIRRSVPQARPIERQIPHEHGLIRVEQLRRGSFLTLLATLTGTARRGDRVYFD